MVLRNCLGRPIAWMSVPVVRCCSWCSNARRVMVPVPSSMRSVGVLLVVVLLTMVPQSAILLAVSLFGRVRVWGVRGVSPRV